MQVNSTAATGFQLPGRGLRGSRIAARASVPDEGGAADGRATFAAGADGLRALRKANPIRVPQALGVGYSDSNARLALEWIQLGAWTDEVESTPGERLASQHRHTAAAFGWHRDNTIGGTPQVSDRLDDRAAADFTLVLLMYGAIQ